MIVLEVIGRFVFGFLRALLHPAHVFVLLWCVFSVGMTWVMLSDSDLPYIGAFQGAASTAPGEVIECEPMPFYDSGDETTDAERVRAIRFKFKVNGQPILDTSYVRGVDYMAGQVGTIEYMPDDSSTARVQGTELMPTDRFLWFVLIFPAVGALMVVVSLTAAVLKGFLAAGEALRGP